MVPRAADQNMVDYVRDSDSWNVLANMYRWPRAATRSWCSGSMSA